MKESKKKLALGLSLMMVLSVYMPISASGGVVHPVVGASVSTNNAVQVVSTQAELESALTKSGVTQIVIQTDKAVSFEIKKGSYSAKKLVVRAPQAEIKNAGSFQSVTIYSISDQGYVENADHNVIRVLALSGKIIVSAGKTVDSLTVEKKSSKVTVEVSGTVQQMDVKKASTLTMEVTGSIKTMNVNATSTVTMTGDSKDTTIVVNRAAKDSRITVSAPATVKLKAATTVTLKSGAENAKLVVPKSSEQTVSYTLVNDTDATLRLNTSSGPKTLAQGKSYNGKESGSSNTTITSGGWGSGSFSGSGSSSSGGSTGGSSGGTTGEPGGGDEDDDQPIVAKSELPIAAEVLSLHSFCVYVDAADAPGEYLDVTVTPAVGVVTQSAIVKEETKVIYSEDGKPQHIYGYCYTYTTTGAFEPDEEYTVAVSETDAYSFKEQTMKADLGEDEKEDELKPYEDAFRDVFEGYCFVVGKDMDEKALDQVIEYRVEHSAPNSPLREVYKSFEQDNVTIQITVAESIIDEEVCPVTIQLQQDDKVRTFTCNMTFARESTDKGSLLAAKYTLLSRNPLDFDQAGSYSLDKTVAPYMIEISQWQSSDPSLVNINDYTATVTMPQVGAEDVIIKALFTKGAESIWLEKTITLDSGLRMPEYTVNISGDDAGTLKADLAKKSGASDGKELVTDATAFQWYRVLVGSNADIEEIEGATGESYLPGSAGETGAYWYFCKLISSYGNETNEFYSDFVKVTIQE